MDSEYVYLDVGYKSEGKIPVTEFKETPNVGEDVSVVLVKREGKNGELVVSKKKADAKVLWKELKDAFQDHNTIPGKVVKSIKGGFEVDLGIEVRAFIPISKMDLHRIETPEDYIGLETQFYIERLYNEKSKVNIVLSRREWLEETLSARKKNFLKYKHR